MLCRSGSPPSEMGGKSKAPSFSVSSDEGVAVVLPLIARGMSIKGPWADGYLFGQESGQEVRWNIGSTFYASSVS